MKKIISILLAAVMLITLSACAGITGGSDKKPSKANDIDTATLTDNCESAVFYEYSAVDYDGTYYDRYQDESIYPVTDSTQIEKLAEAFTWLKEAKNQNADDIRANHFGPMWSIHFVKSDGSEVVFEETVNGLDKDDFILCGDKVYEYNSDWATVRNNTFYPVEKEFNSAADEVLFDYTFGTVSLKAGHTIMGDNGFNDVIDATTEDDFTIDTCIAAIGQLEPMTDEAGIGILEPNFVTVETEKHPPLTITFITGNLLMIGGDFYYTTRDVDVIYAEILDILANQKPSE